MPAPAVSAWSSVLQGDLEKHVELSYPQNYCTQVEIELGYLHTNSHQPSFKDCLQGMLIFKQSQPVMCKGKTISMASEKAPGTEMHWLVIGSQPSCTEVLKTQGIEAQIHRGYTKPEVQGLLGKKLPLIRYLEKFVDVKQRG